MSGVTSRNYVELAILTESDNFKDIESRVSSQRLIRLLHASMGLCTEAGEFADLLKRHIFYGTELDILHVIEEVGDILWYCALAIDETGVCLDAVLEKNIRKLAKRYPNKFEKVAAVIRDLEAERRELE